MTEVPETPDSPPLSPGFDRARMLSRILAVILAIGFWLGIVLLIAFAAYQLSPELQEFVAARLKHPARHMLGRHFGLVALHALSSLVAIFYARKLFVRLAAGDVFTPGTIGAMRSAAMWIVIAGLFPPDLFVLMVGIAAYVAAYVMAEARRLADDSASIV